MNRRFASAAPSHHGERRDAKNRPAGLHLQRAGDGEFRRARRAPYRRYWNG
jgi:hypothetical protein